MLTTYLEDNLMILLYAAFNVFDFKKYMAAGKTLLYFTNLLFPNDYRKMARWFISSLKINMAKENIHIKK